MKPKLPLGKQIAYAVGSGMVGFVLTVTAGLVFTRYAERKVLKEPADNEEAA